MTRRFIGFAGAAASVLAASLAAGCTVQWSALLGEPGGSPPPSQASAQDQAFDAFGVKADQIVAIDPAGILAKNSSKLAGAVSLPQGILGKNSSKFKIQAYSEVPLPHVPVAVMNLDLKVLSIGGKRAVVWTDSRGRYDFADIPIPEGLDVIIAVWPASEMLRLYNYTRTRAGDNVLDIDLPSTLVTRFLMGQAKDKGKGLSDFDRAKVETARALTRGALEKEDLVVGPELMQESRKLDLLDLYYSTVMSRSSALHEAWLQLLGSEPARPGQFDEGPPSQQDTLERM